MIRAKACFVAEGVAVDRDTNQVSVWGLVERLDASGYPVGIPKVTFVCLWERTLADPAYSTADFLVAVDGRQLVRQQVAVDFGAGLAHRSTIRVEGLTLEHPGNVVFGLAIPGHVAAEWSVIAAAAPLAVGSEPRVGGASAATTRVWDSGQLTTPAGSVTIAR